MSKAENSVANGKKVVKAAASGTNVQQLAQTDTFMLETVITGEFVQKLVLNWAIASGMDVKEIKETRGRGYVVSHAAKVGK